MQLFARNGEFLSFEKKKKMVKNGSLSLSSFIIIIILDPHPRFFFFYPRNEIFIFHRPVYLPMVIIWIFPRHA